MRRAGRSSIRMRWSKPCSAGRIQAAVDVTDPEPLPMGHPLWSAPNLLITPHIAGSSPGMMDRVMRFIGDQCRRYLAGEPLAHVVTEGY